MSWRPLFDSVAWRARSHGLDLAAGGRADVFHREAPEGARLPAVGREDALVIVLGNTRALWAPFVAALEREPARREVAHPLDAWIEEVVGAIAAETLADVPHAVRFAHDPPPRRLPFARLAHAVGLGQLGPSLCIHPEHGPWIALRAALVVGVPGPATAPRPRPCDACAEQPCVPAMAEAAARATPGDLWSWLAVRDACPVGPASRYGPRQLAYHYGRDRRMLEAEVREGGDAAEVTAR